MKINKNKKIMILGASILQLPAIIKAKEMGLEVIAVDIDKNAVGFKEADIGLEISTIDIPNVVKAAELYKIDGIMTLASDMPMRTVAAVASKLNLIGISEETALKATNKAVMRECLKDNNIPIPKFFRIKTYKQYLDILINFTDNCIIKPADNSGSRGIFLINNLKNEKMIKYAFEYSKKHSRSGEVLVEEYMQGPEVSVESISIDEKTHIIAITDKLTTGSPRFVELGHSQPSILSENVKNEIKKITIETIKAIGIKNGPSHTELKITNEGPKVVEIGARLGGDNITTHLVPISTGVDMVKSCINIALGEMPDLNIKQNKGAVIRYFNTNKGILHNVYGIEEAKKINGISEINIVKKIGEHINDIDSSSDRVGFVIAEGNSVDNAIRKCKQAMSCITISIN